ncbi:hypothetical protein LSAT2_013134 [Lamellibrachia satsuma]|nr:hypothetical protein LSAT2_013134 [Lamellibrachia satsuma]
MAEWRAEIRRVRCSYVCHQGATNQQRSPPAAPNPDFLSLDDDLVEWNPDKVAPHVQEAYALITTCTKRQFADKVRDIMLSDLQDIVKALQQTVDGMTAKNIVLLAEHNTVMIASGDET